ncbi:MAG: sigma-54-dependent Fis family transcriptional regulator [Deltaproteobacteria bacterium]|nr:sigma-54-dependent Fis family transcriptional regulator [Deltaproteobacteria bacterium]
MKSRVLVVDDDADMCRMLEASLSRRGFSVSAFSDPARAFEEIRSADFDVAVTDLNMKGMNGFELCERILGDRPDVPVVVITAFGSMDSAIKAIRAGAYDFLPKPFETDALVVALERAIQHRVLRQEVKRLRAVVEQSQRFNEIIGASPAMQATYALLDRISDSESPVLITGESGCGKELVARALHARSRRHSGPFVAVSCAAMPEALLESELFGHVRGAFTDAHVSRAGIFQKASGGTLFLDEIGELPLSLQPKLLRALQEKTIRPVGSDEEVPFDARIVTATNRDLETEVHEKTFRSDLFYRINVICVELPPLRSRGTDVLLLAHHFLEKYSRAAGKTIAGISSGAASKLLAYVWPGNVRELSNAIERAVAVAQYSEISVEDLPSKIRDHERSHVVVVSDDPSDLVPLDTVEQQYIQRVVESTGGNKTLAAKILGLDRTTLYRKLERSK